MSLSGGLLTAPLCNATDIQKLLPAKQKGAGPGAIRTCTVFVILLYVCSSNGNGGSNIYVHTSAYVPMYRCLWTYVVAMAMVVVIISMYRPLPTYVPLPMYALSSNANGGSNIYVPMYVCTSACLVAMTMVVVISMYLCMYVCMYVCTSAYVCTFLCLPMYLCTH